MTLPAPAHLQTASRHAADEGAELLAAIESALDQDQPAAPWYLPPLAQTLLTGLLAVGFALLTVSDWPGETAPAAAQAGTAPPLAASATPNGR